MLEEELSQYLAQFELFGPKPQLVDANPWLTDSATCLAVASVQIISTDALPHARIRPALHRLCDQAQWPVFTVRCASEVSLHVVWRNLEGDAGLELLLRSPGGDVHALSEISGNQMWPGLRWPELVQVAAQATNLTPSDALLVLFPFVGDFLPGIAAELLGAALARHEVEDAGAYVAPLLRSSDPTSQLAGRRPAWEDVDGVVTFRGFNSTRGGASSPEFRATVGALLASASQR